VRFNHVVVVREEIIDNKALHISITMKPVMHFINVKIPGLFAITILRRQISLIVH